MLLSGMVVQDAGLTVGKVLSDLPHDAAAIVVYAMVGAFIYFIWRGSRKRPGKQP